MELLNAVMEIGPFVWGCISGRIDSVFSFDDNVDSVRYAILELEASVEEVTTRMEYEEQPQVGGRKRKRLESWCRRTKACLQEEANRVLQSAEQNQTWPPSYNLAQKVKKMLAKLKELLDEGECFETVLVPVSYPLVEKRSLEDTVGLDVTFQQAWRWINDDNIRILGLYGVGGAGKTTLLAKINNEFLGTSKCLVIWVGVTTQGTVHSVQEAIRNRVNLKDERWDYKGAAEKAPVVGRFLGTKRIVLLLDDLWERLDLSQVGIPLPRHGANMVKKVFTTRSQDICRQMGAQKKIGVTCLSSSDAKALFNAKVGEETLNSHPEIPQLAKILAEKCGGLPIALITLGRAMLGKTLPHQWTRAIKCLSKSRSNIPVMGSEVYPILKLSYDSLSNETIKQCFLYCALFPEGCQIPNRNLINCWIAEGLIHEYEDISEASDQGLDIIESLKSACLLERGYPRLLQLEGVKMHDVIRDMALWIIRQEGRNWDKRTVEEEMKAISRENINKALREWESMMKSRIAEEALQIRNAALRASMFVDAGKSGCV